MDRFTAMRSCILLYGNPGSVKQTNVLITTLQYQSTYKNENLYQRYWDIGLLLHRLVLWQKIFIILIENMIHFYIKFKKKLYNFKCKNLIHNYSNLPIYQKYTKTSWYLQLTFICILYYLLYHFNHEALFLESSKILSLLCCSNISTTTSNLLKNLKIYIYQLSEIYCWLIHKKLFWFKSFLYILLPYRKTFFFIMGKGCSYYTYKLLLFIWHTKTLYWMQNVCSLRELRVVAINNSYCAFSSNYLIDVISTVKSSYTLCN